MFQFTFPALMWGFLIAGLPVLIHLINMMRHRRIRWAAMEFLLQSYKKHRRWIWLKQLLLLLMRVLAIILIVAMLAQWTPDTDFFESMGGKVTHHYVLLDDSYSMGDREGEATVFDRARQVVTRIGEQARQQGRHRFTLLRFSRIAAGEANPEVDQVADLNSEFVGRDFDVLLEETQSKFEISQLAVGPGPGLEVIRNLIESDESEEKIVYVVSDFRQKDWDSPVEIKEMLGSMEESDAKINLVRAVESTRSNLGIVALTPENYLTRAAGVPLFVNIEVMNHGDDPARNVQVSIRTVYHDASSEDLAGVEETLPVLQIDEIAPGASEVRRVQVYFPTAGKHIVHASLQADDVPADNHRWCVVDFTDGEPVLIIDGSESSWNWYFTSSAFAPNEQRARTGIRPEQQPVSFLRDRTASQLKRYSAIYLFDVDLKDPQAIKHLEEYVDAGGGVAIFMGENVKAESYNQNLYKNGNGLLPIPFADDGLLIPPLEDNTPDIIVRDHPIFRVFLGQLNPRIRSVHVERYFRPRDDWKSEEVPGRDVALFHNQHPFVVERNFGAGRVVVFTTSLAPDWTDLTQEAAFIITVLKLHSYLTTNQRRDDTKIVGETIEVPLAANEFQPDVVFRVPAGLSVVNEIKRKAEKPTSDSPTLIASLGKANELGQRSGETDQAGVYECVAINIQGNQDVSREALNVDASEGELAIVSKTVLESELSPLKVEIKSPKDFMGGTMSPAGGTPSMIIMTILILLLLGEQAFAYAVSYHPPRGGATA